MSRKLRPCFEGGFYHVTNRGDNQEKIFSSNSDRVGMLDLLKKTKKKFGFKLHAFVFMRNHFHLLIETTDQGTISEIMQYINGNYTKLFNWIHKRTGHLFQGRFHSSLIDKDAYLLEVSRYIHLNPVRAGLAKLPEDYKWSSYRGYLKKTKDDFIDKDLILSMISNDTENQVELYSKFVKAGISGELKVFKEKLYKGQLGPRVAR